MKPKKTPKADLHRRRALFMEIGFITALAAAIVVFSVGQTGRVLTDVSEKYIPPAEELPEIPRTEDKRPEMKPQIPKFVAGGINIVPNSREIDTSKWVFPDEWDEPVIIPPVVDEEPDEGIPLLVVSDPPTFQGGDLSAFRNWVMSRLVYPRAAQENNIQGRVQLRFVVEKDGSVSNIELDFAPDRSLAGEAVRVVSMSPKWEPGRHRNKPVRVVFVLPIEFRLAY